MSQTRAMQKFKRDLLQWKDRMKRAGYLLRLEVEDTEFGFALTGHWNDGYYRKEFTPRTVMVLTTSPGKMRPRHRVCWYRDEFVRGALAARGI